MKQGPNDGTKYNRLKEKTIAVGCEMIKHTMT